MRMFVIEGTPDEVADVMRSISGPDQLSKFHNGAKIASPPKNVGGPDRFVTAMFARKVFKRLQLSAHMEAVLKTLYNAKDGFISTAELGASIKYSVPQFSGLLGAFGRRVANTDGFDETAYFFDYRGGPGAWEYRLPPSVREAMELEGLA